jgi:hypothetical protein
MPAVQKSEIGKNAVPDQLRQEAQETSTQQKN